MEFNMWRDYLGLPRLMEAMRKECEEVQLPRSTPMMNDGVWDFGHSQSWEDQEKTFLFTERAPVDDWKIVTPNKCASSVKTNAPLRTPQTRVNVWDISNPRSSGLDVQKTPLLHAPRASKTQMDSSEMVYLPSLLLVDTEMTSLDKPRSKVDGLDFTSPQACGDVRRGLKKGVQLSAPRIKAVNSKTSHTPSCWSEVQENTLLCSADISPRFSPWSVADEAAPAHEGRAKEDTMNTEATNSWWMEGSKGGLLRGRKAQVGLSDLTSNLIPQHPWRTDSHERGSLCRSRSEVGCFDTVPLPLEGHDDATQPSSKTRVGTLGIAPPHSWRLESQKEDYVRSSRMEVGIWDLSLPHSWWSDDQEGSLQLTPSPETNVLDPAAPYAKLSKGWGEILLLASRAMRGATDSKPQHAAGLEQQKDFRQITSKVDSPSSETISPKVCATKASSWCVFCKHNGESKHIYIGHSLKDSQGHVQCPILREYVCPQCNATGDDAHTRRFCPMTEKGYASVYQYPNRNASGKRNQKST